jgi:hypothetical protein
MDSVKYVSNISKKEALHTMRQHTQTQFFTPVEGMAVILLENINR